jgi:hypothetical protein
MEALIIPPIEAEISLLSQLKLLNGTLPDKIEEEKKSRGEERRFRALTHDH